MINPWLAYRDRNGVGYAQPDLVLVQEGKALLMECKLSQTDQAKEQMLDLYAPLLTQLLGVTILCLQVCRNLHWYAGRWMVKGPQELIRSSKPGSHTWHFLG